MSASIFFHNGLPVQPAGAAPTCAGLDAFRIVSAAGEDAMAFLHGQLTQDVTGLPIDRASLAGYCTAKGRLLATLVMWRAPLEPTETDARWHALVRADLAQALVKRLSMFVLRAKAKLSLSTTLNAFGVQASSEQSAALQAAAGGALPDQDWQRTDLPTGTWIAAPGSAGPRWWWIASQAQLEASQDLARLLGRGDEQAWRALDLAAGLPWIAGSTQDLFIPQTVNLELAGGVSFTKGCYPGQEVVARSHYRGTVKRRMAYGHLDEPGIAAQPGADVYDARDAHEPSGRVVDAAGAALLFETTLASLPEGDLRLGSADGPRIRVLPLPYAF
ncbi:folate-binding protein YgfZ [Bordetella sp. FB-8]|uniref:CAF17-like 4Fe-4S cluster assembly/insertion protein YgfZ n=1 Tax=Bordetella sp. FB-8 TaxID=1159870 RepID=UPI00038012DF|nr:folate-binding protein YgfZ [Bordetella sp. FB-8]